MGSHQARPGARGRSLEPRGHIRISAYRASSPRCRSGWNDPKSRSRQTRRSATGTDETSPSPLIWVASMIGSYLMRIAASSLVSGLPSKVSTVNMRPLLRLPLCGIANTSEPVFCSRVGQVFPQIFRVLAGILREGKGAGWQRSSRRGTARCDGGCSRRWRSIRSR